MDPERRQRNCARPGKTGGAAKTIWYWSLIGSQTITFGPEDFLKIIYLNSRSNWEHSFGLPVAIRNFSQVQRLTGLSMRGFHGDLLVGDDLITEVSFCTTGIYFWSCSLANLAGVSISGDLSRIIFDGRRQRMQLNRWDIIFRKSRKSFKACSFANFADRSLILRADSPQAPDLFLRIPYVLRPSLKSWYDSLTYNNLECLLESLYSGITVV